MPKKIFAILKMKVEVVVSLLCFNFSNNKRFWIFGDDWRERWVILMWCSNSKNKRLSNLKEFTKFSRMHLPYCNDFPLEMFLIFHIKLNRIPTIIYYQVLYFLHTFFHTTCFWNFQTSYSTYSYIKLAWIVKQKSVNKK